MFSHEDKQQLLDTAAASILHGLEHGQALQLNPLDYSEALQQIRASFVTLHINDELRGCIGMLKAIRPLIVDIAENAWCAAFKDPRFTPLHQSEYNKLQYHISVLGPAEPVHFSNEADLLQQLKPGIDGLILEDKGYRGTFLPSVWDSLPEASDFLRHLKQKAGLLPDYWSDTISVQRYSTEDIQ